MSRAAVALAMFQPGFRNWSKTLVSGYVKVFGRRPSRTFPRALRPASENLQGTKPREGARVGRCRTLSYGILAVDGRHLRSAARAGEGGDGVAAQMRRIFLSSGPVCGGTSVLL